MLLNYHSKNEKQTAVKTMLYVYSVSYENAEFIAAD